MTENYDAEVLVVSQPADPNAPFVLKETDKLKIQNGSILTAKDLLSVSQAFQPDMVYVANWRDKRYYKVARYFKLKGIPVVQGMDNLWKGTFRQRILSLFGKRFIHRFATHLLVPGSPHHAFATRLGYDQPNVLSGLYCANTPIFEAAREKAGATYPKKILFVGRFVSYKKPLELANAFREVQEELRSDWSLHFIGRGPLEKDLQKYVGNDLEVHDFVQPALLPETLVKHGIFCLPSNQEHWGLVVHEAAAAGMPLLLSDTVGAASDYLISGYNGYAFKTDDISDLKLKLRQIMTTSNEEIIQMGKGSMALAKRWNYERWAANFISILS